MKHQRFIVTGMTCAACQANVTRTVSNLTGVEKVEVNLLSGEMTLDYDENLLSQETVIAAVQKAGYGAASMDRTGPSGGNRDVWADRRKRTEEDQQAMRRRLTLSILLLIPLMYLAMGHMLGLPLPGFLSGSKGLLTNAFTQFLIAAIIGILNKKFFVVGFKALAHRSPNMDSLVALGSGASFLYGIFALYRMMWGLSTGDLALTAHYGHQLYFESAAMILALVTVGKYLEARSKAKTSDALTKLVDLSPKTALVLRNGMELELPAEQVVEGDVVIIRPGDRIPVDGLVLEGTGFVDQSAITGESIPVEKNPGDPVISATMNKNGSFRLKATRVGEDTTLSQIIRLVDEAGNSKAPIARLADRVSGIFVPVVMTIAVITTLIWLLAGQSFEFALSCGITVLVISCPCALGLATPVAIMVGTGKAAESGILMKSAASLEQLASVDTVILDKTGTITSGHPGVTDVVVEAANWTEKDFLALAAALESGSEHPLAEAVVEYAKALSLPLPQVSNFLAVTGRGVSALVDGALCLGGNLTYLQEAGCLSSSDLDRARSLTEEFAGSGKTPLLFAREGQLLGLIAAADSIKPDSRLAIEKLLSLGLSVQMVTGDHPATARAIAGELGLTETIAGVLPAGKEAAIRSLQAQGRKVAMVGDGINDAPALVGADVGIAIGAGSDIAIDSADVVLMKNSLLDVVSAIELSRQVVKNIRMNLFWAFFYNALGIPVAAGALYPLFGLRLSPMIGSAAMSLSSVSVCLNALRLRFFKPETLAEASLPEQETTKPVVSANLEIPAENPAERKEESINMKKCFAVEGMMCKHCVAHVEKALQAVEGVAAVAVSLEANTAEVTLVKDVADETLIAAIVDAGYEAKLA